MRQLLKLHTGDWIDPYAVHGVVKGYRNPVYQVIVERTGASDLKYEYPSEEEQTASCAKIGAAIHEAVRVRIP